jgi:hypothetical protein
MYIRHKEKKRKNKKKNKMLTTLTVHKCDSLKVNVCRALMKTKFRGTYGDTSLSMMENTALCHVSVGTVLRLRLTAPHVFVALAIFWTGSSPHSPDLTRLD